MNFLNYFSAQLRGLFDSLTPGARVTAGLLLAVVVVSIAYLFRQSATGPDAYLFGGAALSDGELTRIELAIADANLSGHVREGQRIRVPAGQQAAYLGAIAAAGAEPADFNTILEKTLDRGTWFESREMQRERIKAGRQRELTEIVRAMPWVEQAAVIVNEQEVRGLNRQRKISASVSIQPKVGEPLDPRRIDTLRKFLARSLGTNPDLIAVTDLGGQSSFAAGGMDPAMFDNPYYKDKVAYEKYKREQILALVRPIVPDAIVEVNAELDDTAAEITSSQKPGNAVLVRSSETTETSTQSTADGGGQPGPTSNGPIPQNVTAAPTRQNQNQSTGGVLEEEYTVAMETREVTRQGFTPKEVLASVFIPAGHFRKLWEQRNPDATTPPAPADLKAIEGEVLLVVQNAVEPLTLKSADRSRDTFKRVSVQTLETLPPPTIEPPSVTDTAVAWTGRYWNTLAMLGLATFSLLLLRSVVKNAPPSAASAAPPLTLTADEPQAAANESSPEPAPTTESRPRLRLKKGVSVKDDLIEIVREDPDAAADILRTWIAKAS